MTSTLPSTHARGETAERVAACYLEARGYTILERNYRCKAGEIDLIAEDSARVLCFIEVRSRSQSERDFGLPVETVGRAKQARIARAAETYLAERGLDLGRPARFDVVGVSIDPATGERALDLIENAFEANRSSL